MDIPLTTVKKGFKFTILFGLVGWAAALYAVYQIQSIDSGYRAALERQANAAFTVSNANRLLVSERDDISDMLIQNTASTDAADLAQLNFDKTSLDEALTSVAALAPDQTSEIVSLQALADQVVTQDCARAVALGSTGTTDQTVLASQREFLSACAPKFAPLIKGIEQIQNHLRNERNANTARVSASATENIEISFGIIFGGLGLLLGIVFLNTHTLLVIPVRAETEEEPVMHLY